MGQHLPAINSQTIRVNISFQMCNGDKYFVLKLQKCITQKDGSVNKNDMNNHDKAFGREKLL